MIQEFVEKCILETPALGSLYRKRAAKLKRGACLLLYRFGMLKPVSFVQWLVTNQCNASCPFCEASAGHAGADELTLDEAKSLIRDLKRMKVRRLVLSGGEPLLRPDISEIMDYANQCSIGLGLVTNGWRVRDLESRLRQFRFFLYFTSIDGEQAFHDKTRGITGAFTRALEGLALFGRMRVPVRIVNTVVHPGNILQLESLAEIVKNSGATSWRLTPVSDVGRAAGDSSYCLTREQLQYLASFIRGKRNTINVDYGESHMYLGCFAEGHAGRPFFCGAGLTRCSIMPNGDVLGCHQVYDLSLSEGNVRDKGFPQIWKHGFERFRSKKFKNVCLQCDHLDACQGGCWAEMEKTGTCLGHGEHGKTL